MAGLDGGWKGGEPAASIATAWQRLRHPVTLALSHQLSAKRRIAAFPLSVLSLSGTGTQT